MFLNNKDLLKQLSAAPIGANKISVFDVKTGVTSYSLNLCDSKNITSVLATGEHLTVVYETHDKKTKRSVYNLAKGVLSYSNIIG